MSGNTARRIKRTTKQAFLASIANCPICDVALDSGNAALEHVPPKKIGNRAPPACVTCQHCNNRFGSRYEAPMDRAERNRHLMSFHDDDGQRIMSGELEVEKGASRGFSGVWHDTWVRPGISLDETTSILIEDAGPSNPNVIKGWIKSMYLLVWCATNGSAARLWWAQSVKQYLRASGTEICPGVELRRCRHDVGDGAVFLVRNTDPVYVAVWGQRACAFGLTDDMAGEDGWTLEVSHHKPGPIVYGCGEWLPSGHQEERRR